MSHSHASAHHSRLVNRSPFYYGWVILLMGTLGLIMTAPGQTYAVSIFIEHFITDLGISRSLISTLYTAGTLVGSFALPFVGRRIDRHGPRVIMLVIALLFGGACLYMGSVRNAAMLAVGFVLIRMLGQGSLSLVSVNLINQWWVRRRGAMMGLSGLFVSLIGLGGIPSLISWLIPLYGWQTTYRLLGVLLLVGLAPLVLLFVRNQPENYGLQPDGARPLATEAERLQSITSEENWTLLEARSTLSFWVLTLGTASIGMLSTGLFFHMVSIFKDNGLEPTTAAWVYVPIAGTTALVTLSSGILVDRIPVRLLAAGGLFLQATSLLLAQALTGPAVAVLYGVILGTTTGLISTVQNVAWAQYFGRRHLGSIAGLATTLLVVGAALGPMPFGVARDWLGSYNLVLTLSALLPLGFGIANLFVGKPERREHTL